jgi:hypothetical protein
VGALLLSSCCHPSERTLSLGAIYEFHHELLRKIPDNIECELVGFPTHEKRGGLDAAFSPEDASTWNFYSRQGNRQGLTPILLRLRAFPAGNLPRERQLLTWKGMEIEVLHQDNGEEAVNLLRTLRRVFG